MKLKLSILLLACCLTVSAKIKVEKGSVTPQTEYAASLLKPFEQGHTITLRIAGGSPAEGFTIEKKGKKITITGNDGPGVIYGVNRLKEYYLMNRSYEGLTTITEAPEMVLRGACVGLQKTVYLPGHRVYEYPYTPENFPWFYDKALWIKYLDMLAADNMNTVYLWNGHPFASLVKLDDYPFAPEVDDATMQKNQDMFSFLVDEADRRGIRVIQMFYNIILSKPFADHYGLKTQDRNRPITPLISDYTRKSIAAFVQKYPKVGFLVCLGEAMATIDDDVKWMKETIIPGIKDGLKASGRTDEPPIILRSHDTDGPLVLKESLPLYPNIYTMSKYTGESLTTYEPGGPWGETHQQLATAAPCISTMCISWPTWSLGDGRRRPLRRKPCRPCTASIIPKASISIHRPAIGTGPIPPTNSPTAAASCRLIATGCGIRYGDAMPGTATAVKTVTTGCSSSLSIMG